MKNIVRNLTVIILSLILAVDCLCVGAVKNESNNVITPQNRIFKKTLIADNEDASMFIDEFGHFELLNKSTGFIWNSYPPDIVEDTHTIGISKRQLWSEIVVNYVYRDAYGKTSSYEENSVSGIDAVESNGVNVYKTENGAKVVYDFYSICASVTLDYTVKGNRLSVKINGDEISEGDAFKKKVKKYATEEQLNLIQESYITSIWVLPSFGAGTEKDSGFVFVPDGSGAYMNFKPVSYVAPNVSIPLFSEEFAIDEYGVVKEEFSTVTRTAKAYFPMFSIVKNGNGLMGVINQNAENSELTIFKAGRANSYTGVAPQMIYRTVSHTVIGGREVQGISLVESDFEDFAVDYHFLSEDLDYAGIAKHYRNILETKNEIKKSTVKQGLALNAIGAIDVKTHFLGIPCKRLKSLTSYEQLGEIISDLKSKSVDNISVDYLGWNNNGIQNKKINSRFKPIRKLGGNKGFNNLLKFSKEENVDFYFDADMQAFSSSGNGASKLKDAIKTMFDKASIQRKFSYATFMYEKNGNLLIDADTFSAVFKKYTDSAKKYDNTLGLSFNSISSKLYSDFDNKNPNTKSYLLAKYEKSLGTVDQPLAAKSANSYMWKYADKIFETPTSSSRQRIYDGEVPMYQMILHGYIPFTSPSINSNANRNEMFLRAVETGSELCFTVMYENAEAVNGTDYDYLYSTTYSETVSEIVEMYKKYSELNSLIADATVEQYRNIKSGISETVYSNGVSVIVNYTNEDYVTDDGSIVSADAFGYRR